jgi:hypothetical protein
LTTGHEPLNTESQDANPDDGKRGDTYAPVESLSVTGELLPKTIHTDPAYSLEHELDRRSIEADAALLEPEDGSVSSSVALHAEAAPTYLPVPK